MEKFIGSQGGNMKQELIKISRYAGMREDLVQTGGGNTSVKISDTKMLIKASGYQLAEVTEEKGYAIVDYKIIKQFFDNKDLHSVIKDDEKKLLDKSFIEGERPSIETFLHAITGKVTLHTHSVLVNILTARRTGMTELERLFPNALLVGYATPGIELACEYFKECKKNNQSSDVVFLKNHGLIVSGDTYEKVRELTENTLLKISNYLGIDNTRYRNISLIYDSLCSLGIYDRVVCMVNNRNVYELYKKKKKQVWEINFCPDAVVYCGKRILVLPDKFTLNDVKEFIDQYGIPSVIIYKDCFYVVAANVKKAKDVESLLSFTADVAWNNNAQEIDLLTDAEQNFLLDWDAEKYRQNIK